MKKIVAVIAIVALAAGAGAAVGYAAANHGESKVRACTGTERSLAHSLAMQAQGSSLAGFEVKPRQLSAADLELVRTCNRSPSER
jgi:hypothetical protein